MLKNPYHGKFVVIEGINGSGQTTQAKLLAEFLKSKGCDVLLTKEPTKESPVAKVIWKVLDKKIATTPKELQEMFAEDREWYLENIIIPSLKQGKIVISDRYAFSSFAYGSLDIDLEHLIKINDNFILPDLTIFLDVDAETCFKRIRKRGRNHTIFEEKEKLERVRQNFKRIKKLFPNIIEVKGENTIENVHNEIIKIVTKPI